MKEKHLYLFAGVFVVLLLIYFVTKPRHTSVNLDEIVQTIVIGIAKEDVKNIEVYKETGSQKPIQMLFAQREGQWYIPTKFNCKAQKSRIDRLLDDLLEMTGKVRSSDPKHFETYQISDEKGIHLLLKDEANKPLANLIIGKKGEDYNSGFVRFGNKEKVYAVDKNLLSSLNVNGEIDTLSRFKDDTFVDLQAVNQDQSKLEIVGIVDKGKEMVIKKKEKQVEITNPDSTKGTRTEYEWVLLRGAKETRLDQKEVTNFLNTVTKISAQEVVDRMGNSLGDFDKPSRYGMARPSSYIVFKAAGKQQENVLFGKEYEKDKGFYMNVQYDGLVYKVAKSNVDRIVKWVEDLPKKTAR